jgi:hypothetical protein
MRKKVKSEEEKIREEDLFDTGVPEDEEESNIYVSTLRPRDFEYDAKPIADIDYYWTSVTESKKAFAREGYSLGAINALREVKGEQRIQDYVSLRKLLDRIDITQGEIESKITVIIRRKGLEYYKDDNSREKSRIKEYLVYHLRLEAYDWLGQKLNISLEHQGECEAPRKQVVVNVDENGRQYAEYHMKGTRKEYYIPFSKKAVDDILNKYKTDPEEVKFYGFIPHSNIGTTIDFKYDKYNYKQFTELPWEEFSDIAKRAKDKFDNRNSASTLLQKGIA